MGAKLFIKKFHQKTREKNSKKMGEESVEFDALLEKNQKFKKMVGEDLKK